VRGYLRPLTLGTDHGHASDTNPQLSPRLISLSAAVQDENTPPITRNHPTVMLVANALNDVTPPVDAMRCGVTGLTRVPF